ncbi:ThuA domain-containing protein [Paenibacillus aurantius]|uniref:ThuA domain-containing protein n=1 Tax=Paenibacillus aurantius TaxID=2918900 RepID=A0AA96LGB4_9BACL|nr:ThuA domain-containing protein [Paenibacillus aurantius]WNQ12513.1 ThuA domain-containing protein [Paenibacillus aurantius]
MKSALIVQGGWSGHQPKEVAELLAGVLREEQFEVEVSDTLDAFLDAEKLLRTDLIVPVWTMGQITKEQLTPLLEAVRNGTGIAGCHGGMGDSFRNETEYQFMVGGQWVAHPGGDGIRYTVRIKEPNDPLVQGMKDFEVVSEQYYMHVDPGIRVLAVTDFGDTEMPVAWTKTYGQGKVYYNSLGHQADIVAMPETLEMMRRGMVWAAK